MNIDALLEEFGNSYGFGPLKLNESHMVRIAFDNPAVIDLEQPVEGRLYLYGIVEQPFTPPDANEQGVLKHLLAAQLPAKNPEGNILAFDPDDQALIVWRQLSTSGLDSRALAQAIESVLELMEQTRATLTREESAAPTTPDADAASPDLTWGLRA